MSKNYHGIWYGEVPIKNSTPALFIYCGDVVQEVVKNLTIFTSISSKQEQLDKVNMLKKNNSKVKELC